MIFIACSLRSRVHLICNDIKCAHFLLATLANAVSQANVISYKAALRHTSMRRFHLFRNRSNSKHLSQHMFAKSSRANFRSRSTRSHSSLFLLDLLRCVFISRQSLARLLFAGIVKGVLSSIDLSIGSCQMPQELGTMRYSRGCVIGVSLLFILLWGSIDSSSEKSLLWGS